METKNICVECEKDVKVKEQFVKIKSVAIINKFLVKYIICQKCEQTKAVTK